MAGAQSFDEAICMLYKLLKFIYERTGLLIDVNDFAVKNMQVTMQLGYRINMQRLSHEMDGCHYDPESINQIKFFMPVQNGSIVLLMYRTGRIVAVKGTHISQYYEVKDAVMPFLSQFAESEMPARP